VKRRANLIRFATRLGLASALAVAGCRGAGAALGSIGGSPVAKANDLFGALALRFGEADRDSRFAAIRPQLVRHALSPSRIYADTTIWTSLAADTRTVSIAGASTDGRYVLAARAEAARLRGRYGTSSVYAYGSSAGGTLAALLAGEGLVAAAAAKAPISDLLAWEWPLGVYGPDYFEQIGMTPEAMRRLSPLRRRAISPLLILHGRRDRIVPPAMSRVYAVKFTRVRLWVVQGGHHTERSMPQLLNRAFDWLIRPAAAPGA